jgi:hypothetical protein
MKLLMRLLREPLFHFVVIGGLFFVIFAAVDDSREEPSDVIIITPERIDQLAAGFNSVWKRMPTQEETDALIEEDIREEVYYRDALALGLDQNDTIVRRRLRQKMEFLMDTGANLLVPAAGELEAYFVANEQTYQREPHLALEQIYLGDAPDQQTIARSLNALRLDPQTDPSALGERTLLPAQLGLLPRNAVDGVFGKGFFDLVFDFAPGEWAGPVASAYGVHLVRILDNLPARTPPLDKIRDAVLRNWREEKAQEIRELDYAGRRENFVIEIRRGDTQATENQ